MTVRQTSSLSGDDAKVQAKASAALEADPDGFKTRYRERFHTHLNGDNASELFPEYAESAETRSMRVRAVRAPAAALVVALYHDMLREPVPAGKLPMVLFTAGGNGSGKTSSLPAPTGSRAHIDFDSTFSALKPSQANIEAALRADHDVRILYVYREPLQALVHGTLPRAMTTAAGRTVPLQHHVGTHLGAPQTLLAIEGQYADDPRVKIRVFENGGDGTPALLERDVNWLRERVYDRPDVLHSRLREALDAEHAAGRISVAVYEGTACIPSCA